MQVDRRERLAALLAEWKYDQQQLLQNFDADGNGKIDPDEWQTVCQAAGSGWRMMSVNSNVRRVRT
jgi:Ca2+-binding EF-hand superfamily protein